MCLEIVLWKITVPNFLDTDVFFLLVKVNQSLLKDDLNTRV